MSSGTELATPDSWNLDCLLRVKAQVMTRDNETGMWVPLGGGGMSAISLHRVQTSGTSRDGNDIACLILGERIADGIMVLNCELLRDFQYTAVNPTFHHWTTNSRRFGLTFQTSSDATAFQKLIQRLQEKIRLVEPGSDIKAEVRITAVQNTEVSEQTAFNELQEPEENNALVNENRSDIAPELVPETAPRTPCILPYVRIKQPCPPRSQLLPGQNRSSPGLLSQVVPPPRGNTTHGSTTPDKTSGITLSDYGFYVDVSANDTSLDGKQGGTWLESGKDNHSSRKIGHLSMSSDNGDEMVYFSGAYVQFARNSEPNKHEYCYPMFESCKLPQYGTPPRSPYPETQQRVRLSASVPVPVPVKSRRKWLRWKRSLPHRRHPNSGRKSRCVHCNEFFAPEDNFHGACKDAPDRVLACIRTATCMCCRDAVLYHCGGEDSDSDGNGEADCGFQGRRRGCRRWVITILVCLMVPCLWCYLPLRACHRLSTSCRCCGPRHKAER